MKEIFRAGGQHRLQLEVTSVIDKLSKCFLLQGSVPSVSPRLILGQLVFVFCLLFFFTQESTSFRLFEIFEIALSAADEMKIYSWCQ